MCLEKLDKVTVFKTAIDVGQHWVSLVSFEALLQNLGSKS